jgi:hypothetical protein
LHGAGDEGGERDGLGLQLDAAGLDAGHVEDRVDLLEEVLAGAGDRLDHLALLGVEVAVDAAQEEGAEAEDRVERGAQVVAHVGEELAAQAVGLLGLLEGDEPGDGGLLHAHDQAVDGAGEGQPVGGGRGRRGLARLGGGDAEAHALEVAVVGAGEQEVRRRRRRAGTGRRRGRKKRSGGAASAGGRRRRRRRTRRRR